MKRFGFATCGKVAALLRLCFFALLVDEHCRLCGEYIDLLSAGSSAGERASFAICSACAHLIEPEEPILTHLSLLVNDSPKQRGAGETPALHASRCPSPSVPGSDARELLVASGIDYREPMKKLVRRFKYDKDILLKKDLSQILANGWKAIAPLASSAETILVPIPLHWKRAYSRGYNQAALVALEFAGAAGIPVVPGAMRRRKATRPQNKLSREEREHNLLNAFKGNQRLLNGKVVVLVDDVCTSGSTLIECANEAYRCGAEKVVGLTVARAILLHAGDGQASLVSCTTGDSDLIEETESTAICLSP